jgi:hypothetical protein
MGQRPICAAGATNAGRHSLPKQNRILCNSSKTLVYRKKNIFAGVLCGARLRGMFQPFEPVGQYRRRKQAAYRRVFLERPAFYMKGRK